MKRLSLIAAAALAVVFGLAAGFRDAGPAIAVDQPFTTAIDIGVSDTSVGASPDLQVALKLDTACGGPLCQQLPTNPFFDIAITTYSSGITGGALNGGSGLESGGNCAVADATKPCLIPGPTNYGAKIGANNFQINTNQGANAANGNIDTTTGAPPACGPPAPAGNTTQLAAIFDILNGNILSAGGEQISGRDGPDADTLPDTQGDANMNGIADGAEKTPDYIVTLLGSSVGLMKGRGFGVAVIIPGVATTDVNFITLDLTLFGQGYAAVTTLGNTDTAYDPGASQASLTCTPFISTTTTFGTSVANPPAVGGQRVRLNSGTAGQTMYYAFTLSASEDYDDDGVPTAIDRCPLTAQASFALARADADGDGLGDTCDPAPNSADNVPADGVVAPYVTDNVICTAGQVADTVGRGEWNGSCTATPNHDQDIDGDGVHNFSDNCAALANRTQKDSDGDNIGDVCDDNVTSVHAAISAQFPTAASTTRDAKSGGGQGLAAGIDFPPSTCNVATTCNLPAQGVRNGNEGVGGDQLWNDPIVVGAAEGNMPGGTIAGADATPPGFVNVTDSNDDGFPDSLTTNYGFTFNDINSDSDADGCSDSFEAKGNCQGNASDPDVNNNGILDGAEDLSPANGVKDWIDDIQGTGVNSPIAQGNGSSPNGQGSPDSDGDGCSNRREFGANIARPAAGTITYAATTVTDTAATFTPGALKGMQVTSGSNNGVVLSNTATSITLVAPWSPVTPAAGATFVVGSVAQGGARDALNPYDFADMQQANAAAPAAKNKVITAGADAVAVAFYIGISSVSPNNPALNVNGMTYGGAGASVTTPGDSNNDAIGNGAAYERSANGLVSKAGNGALIGADAVVVVNQNLHNCNGS